VTGREEKEVLINEEGDILGAAPDHNDQGPDDHIS